MNSLPQSISEEKNQELQAKVLQRLVAHLQERTDVQNIDMMNLAGFCRNCLSNWYKDAAADEGIELTKNQSRELIYGMPYDEWKSRYQTEATEAQQAAFEASKPDH